MNAAIQVFLADGDNTAPHNCFDTRANGFAQIFNAPFTEDIQITEDGDALFTVFGS
jgi:hypothetical protein